MKCRLVHYSYEIWESLVKRGSVLVAVCLVLAGCSTSISGDPASAESTATQTVTETAAPTPAIKENSFLEYSWKKADFALAENVLTAGESSFVLPEGATEVKSADERVVWAYRNSVDGQTVVLAAVGVAGAGGSAENYEKVLNDSGHAEKGAVAYVRNATFGATTAMRFDVADPSNHSSIYAFDHNGVAYELTISAPTVGLLEAARNSIAETSIAAQ